MIASIHRLRLTPKHYLQYRNVLRVCLPLVLSLSATTVMEFTDRIFLANYSIEAISAALPAGITSFLFLIFFGGIGGYAGVFIAQYTGRGDYLKIGSIFWQAIWFSLAAAGCIFLLGRFGAEMIFTVAGHAPEVQVLERSYFTILCNGAILYLIMNVFSAFFTGRGLTRPVMLITIIGVLFNIPLDYVLIFGAFGFPELGITGAAIATVFSWFINTLLLGILIFTRANNRQFAILSGWRLHKNRFSRLMRFGIPGSLQFTVDMISFTFFVLLVGKIDTDALAASNIALSINSLTFMPSMGASQGVCILVGQALGSRRTRQAENYVRRAAELLFLYILCADILFFCFPETILFPFFIGHHESAEVFVLAISLLRIVAFYLLFDGFYMIYSGALRGAGDTSFMMKASALAGLCIMILPVYTGITYFSMTVHIAWFCVVAFLVTLFCISLWRYRSGKWKKMIVIEEET